MGGARVTTLVTLRKCTLGNKRVIKTLKFVSASTKGFKGGLAWIKPSKKDMAVTFSYLLESDQQPQAQPDQQPQTQPDQQPQAGEECSETVSVNVLDLSPVESADLGEESSGSYLLCFSCSFLLLVSASLSLFCNSLASQ